MQPILSLIGENLLNRAQNIQSMTASLHSRLSSDMREHCWVIDIAGNMLIIITDNADRATSLRYQQHELLKQINEEFRDSLTTPVTRLKVKIDYKLTKLARAPQISSPRDASDVATAKNYCNRMLAILEHTD